VRRRHGHPLDDGTRRPPAADPRHGWLAALLPAEVTRVRAREPDLARTLADAGLELVEREAEAELGRARDVVGEAPVAIIALQRAEPEARLRGARAARRLASAAGLRVRAAIARRRLRQLGYDHVVVLAWERTDPLVRSRPRGPLAHRFPLNRLVVGTRGPPGRTILQAAADSAAAAARVKVDIRAPVFGSSGVVVALGKDIVLRVALGRGRQTLEPHVRALERLGAAEEEPALTERLPRLLASGDAGRAAWAIEARLPGAIPPPPLGRSLIDDCVAFLVALHRAGADSAEPVALTGAAEVVAGISGPGDADRVRALAERADAELAGLPRGTAHGDFWSGNLLARGNRLTGVVDWGAAGPGRLPVLDLLHLRVSELRELDGLMLGPALLRFARPTAPSADPALRAYLERLGLSFAERDWAGLVAAYWLHALARELRDPDRLGRHSAHGWRAANLDRMLAALEPALFG
jgi:aminoglycoside phosphotransferase (APT) family kinase protein